VYSNIKENKLCIGMKELFNANRVIQPSKELPAFYGTQRFITTRAHHWSLW
jgi:hypothetical protein